MNLHKKMGRAVSFYRGQYIEILSTISGRINVSLRNGGGGGLDSVHKLQRKDSRTVSCIPKTSFSLLMPAETSSFDRGPTPPSRLNDDLSTEHCTIVRTLAKDK